ncbi:MAG: hypothetical protein EA368_12880 [Leptolyngbya sp. DLM2.Bin27]|nr:MAG: hypothetical protein EA368_12880 [Leptolyngbya sp. DLM2.Bin27]
MGAGAGAAGAGAVGWGPGSPTNSNRPLRDRQNPGTDWRILPSQGRGTHTTSRQSSWVSSAST